MSKFKEWRNKNIIYRRQWERDYYNNNKDKEKESVKKYENTPNGKIKRKEINNRYDKKHRKKRNDFTKARYKENRINILKFVRKYNGTQALDRIGKCSLCGKIDNNTHIHHLLPRWFSHDDSKNNLIEVCRSCHKRIDVFIIYFISGRI